MTKKVLLVAFCLAGSISLAQNETVIPPPPQEEKFAAPPPSMLADDPQAEFPGGRKALWEYLGANLNYPERALKDSIEGKCYVRFVVNAEGKVTSPKITRSVPNCPECDQEVLRVIRAMPNWIPGKVNGKPVATFMDLPVTFRLD